MRTTDTASQVLERLGPARDRAVAAGHDARAIAQDVAGRAQEAAYEAAAVARERAGELAEAMEPTARQVSDQVNAAARRAVGVASTLPAVLSGVLGVLAKLLGDVAEQGRVLAHRVEPPRSVRRRSRLRAVLWFAGGFAAGAATGWVLHDRLQAGSAASLPEEERPDLPVRPEASSPYGAEAAAIDARRENIGA